MRLSKVAVAAASVLLWAGPAAATDVLEGDIQLGAGNFIQQGRLVRNNVAGQGFAGSESYPGTNNSLVSFHYAMINAPFASNAFQDVYYLINFDDDATDLFASAYNGSYDPTAKQTNWLGDAGRSGNYVFFPGAPGDALYFGVKVAQGGSLALVVNDTIPGLGTSSRAHYLIQAFSDVDYDENFMSGAASVPEPASWAMMILGMGAIGFAMRRQKVTTRVFYVA